MERKFSAASWLRQDLSGPARFVHGRSASLGDQTSLLEGMLIAEGGRGEDRMRARSLSAKIVKKTSRVGKVVRKSGLLGTHRKSV